MPKQALYLLRWSPEASCYQLFMGGETLVGDVLPGDSAWLVWLDDSSSFAFHSRAGAHCTVRKEAIKGRGVYWYGYRFLRKRTVKRYLGRTADLSIAHLEEVAESFSTLSDPQGLLPAQESEGSGGPSSRAPASSIKTSSPLLETRLHPPRLPSKLVERSRLFERLEAWRSYRLTLISAPAGFGKTTLVNSWLSGQYTLSDVAWVSLDGSDNDLFGFWRVILLACQVTPEHEIPPLFLSSSQPVLQAISLEDVLISFLNTVAQQKRPRLLILEDYHLISESRIHETFAFFLTRLPEAFHIILMTRTEPPLPLARLRVSGELNEISTNDLRFSLEESTAFLQQTVATSLSLEVLESLNTHLEGWAAGLRLLSLFLQGTTSQSQLEAMLSTFRGSHRSIRDYLVTEVLHAQTEQLQNFLLRTSVLPRLSANLCAAVTGQSESADLLEASERANLFLEALDSNGEWYRYHALFAEAMQYEARRRLGEEELRRLFSVASCWFEQDGLLSEAIETALKAQDSQRSALLLERYMQAVPMPRIHEYHTIYRWLKQIPEAVLLESPLLCSRYALTLVFVRDSDRSDPGLSERIENFLARAEAGWQASNNFAGLGEIFAFRSLFSFQQGNQEQAVIWARRALDWLPAAEQSWRGMSLMALGMEALQAGRFNDALQIFTEIKMLWQTFVENYVLDGITFLQGIICFEQGALHQAASHFRSLCSETRLPQQNPISLAALFGLAKISYEWNDLDQVSQLLQEISVLGEQITFIPQELQQMIIGISQASLQQAWGETDLAMQALTTILPRLRLLPDGFSLYFYDDALSRLVQIALKMEDYATAQYWLNDVAFPQGLSALLHPDASQGSPWEITSDTGPHSSQQIQPAQSTFPGQFVFLEQRTLLLVRLSLVRKEEEAALRTLAARLSAAQAAGWGRRVLQIRLLMAQAYASRRQIEEARQALLEALKQGYIEGYQRLFLDEGKWLFSLLQDLLPHVRGQVLRGYAQTLLRAFVPQPPGQPPIVATGVSAIFEALSAQEQRVLRLLAAGNSNSEIARELVVSVNTVRSQVQSIYRKLQVSNRHAAREVAYHLRLL